MLSDVVSSVQNDTI